MAFANRLYSVLESELRKHLPLSFSIVGNLTRPGSRLIHAGDLFRIKIWVRNDSALSILRMQGLVTPSAIASFESLHFEVTGLAPRAQHELGLVDARIRSGETRPDQFLFNQLATVTLSAEADLSQFRFCERDLPLTYVHQASEAEPALAGPAAARGPIARPLAPRPARRPWRSFGRSIPLSPLATKI